MAGMRARNTRAIFTLVMWTMWEHRNDIVSEGATSSTLEVIKRVDKEGTTWRHAGLIKGDLDPFFGWLARWVSERE